MDGRRKRTESMRFQTHIQTLIQCLINTFYSCLTVPIVYISFSLFRLEKPVFRIKLEALKLSHLFEHDMLSMRRSTNKLQQDYHDQNVRPSGW